MNVPSDWKNPGFADMPIESGKDWRTWVSPALMDEWPNLSDRLKALIAENAKISADNYG